MTGPDLKSLTSGAATFSEEVGAAEDEFRPGDGTGRACVHFGDAGLSHMNEIWRFRPGHPPTIDAPPAETGARIRGPKWRLSELKASARRLSEMVPKELERVRRRRAQWLGDA